MPSSKSEQRLKRRHRRLPTIVTKYEFIKVDLELITADTMMSPEQPLLEISNGPVCQGYYGLRAFSQVNSQRLAARHVLEASLFQPSKALQSVGVYRGTGVTLSLRKASRVSFLKSGITAMRARPVVVLPRFSTATSTRAAFRPLSWRLPRKPAWVPPTHVSSTSTSPRSGSRFRLIMARRNLCSIIHAVS